MVEQQANVIANFLQNGVGMFSPVAIRIRKETDGVEGSVTLEPCVRLLHLPALFVWAAAIEARMVPGVIADLHPARVPAIQQIKVGWVLG